MSKFNPSFTPKESHTDKDVFIEVNGIYIPATFNGEFNGVRPVVEISKEEIEGLKPELCVQAVLEDTIKVDVIDSNVHERIRY